MVTEDGYTYKETSPDRESDIENNKSENIRNFMQHAQPAGSMIS